MMVKKIVIVLLMCFWHVGGFSKQVVFLSYNDSLPQVAYAAARLKEAIVGSGYVLGTQHVAYEISLQIDTLAFPEEAYAIRVNRNQLSIVGGDGRGLIYGSLSFAESLKNGLTIQKIKAKEEHAYLPFRAIKFNLPWDAYREGYAMRLHLETCKDLRFWETFLDMMVENRFNALTLWNLHPFPYMIRPTNFPEACPFDDQELATWQTFYHKLFGMAKERGIDTYLVNWNIFVSPSFAKAQGVTLDNIENRIHYGNGDTSEVIKRYTRECVKQVLEEYPDLSGIGFTHGEAMRGMTSQQRQDWFEETIIAGMQQANRKSKLIHRVPLEADMGIGGSTSTATEQLTRTAMEKIDFLEGPIWAEIKFNWSHGHSSTKLIKVHGGRLGDTYFKPEPENYKIAWTVRNEDFFCLRWGVPSFIREHIAANSQSYAGGYFIGSEGYIPAKDYFTQPSSAINWKYAFQRQWLFYKLWGRLLYNPATSNEVFKNEFILRYGKKAENLLEASALVGTTPLRLASSFDFTWDFSLYSEGFMAMDKNEMKLISVDRQIKQAPADPAYVSVSDFVNASLSGRTFETAKITPLILSSWLKQDCERALYLLKDIEVETDNPFLYELADIKAWANLGLYFSQKLLGAVALQTYRLQGKEENKKRAVKHLEKALYFWDEVIHITRPIYRDMPLAAYAYPHDGIQSTTDDKRRFHWEKLRPDVLKDVETAKQATAFATN